MISLQGRSFLTLKDFTAQEIQYLLDLASDLKKKKETGYFGDKPEREKYCPYF